MTTTDPARDTGDGNDARDAAPRVRPLDAFPIAAEGETRLGLRDPEGLFEGVVVVSPALAQLLRLLDGTRDAAQICAQWRREHGSRLDAADLAAALDDLRENLVLDGPTARAARARALAAYRAAPARPAAHAGASYPDDPRALDASLRGHRRDAGPLPMPSVVRAVLAPHIDLRGGGPCHGAAAEALARCPARTFVVLGTAHAAIERPLALTDRAFDTPLGRVPVDRDLVDALIARGGGAWRDDELAHRGEHSVEFQALWLRHVHADRDDLRIVPLLVGSVGRWTCEGASGTPDDDPAVADAVDALRELVAREGDRVALVASVDFAHVGPRYGGDGPVSAADLAAVRAADADLLARATAGDADGWIEALARVGDRNSVCGAGPVYAMLRALEGSGLRGTLLRHDDWEIDPASGSYVTFAAVAYARPGEAVAEGAADGPGGDATGRAPAE